MLASQMGMMNQRTIEQWTCHSRHTSVKKSLTSESQQQLMAELSKAIMLPPMYTCTVMKLGNDFRISYVSSNFPLWYEYIKQAMPLVSGCVSIVYSGLSSVSTLNYI